MDTGNNANDGTTNANADDEVTMDFRPDSIPTDVPLEPYVPPTPKISISPILDDQPAKNDYLDFNSYVLALKDLIIHEKTRTPLTLGIFGRWGMGKTTLMQMLEKELERTGIVTIWFNAWQYGNEDELWAAFLQSMLNKIQSSLNLFQLPAFKLKLFLKRINWKDAPRLLLSFIVRAAISSIPVLLIDPVSQQVSPDALIYLQAGGSITTLALAIWIIVKPLVESVRNNVSMDLSQIQKISDFQEHIAFLDKFREHFGDIVGSLPRKGDKRLAVFIDDLDRCSPEQAIQVLDAIKLFVDIRGCIYVLGLDVDVVQKAVASKYADDPTAQREYMSKIIQIPFQLPPLTRIEMKMLLEFLQLDLPDPVCREVFLTGLVVNPREVKRTINIFSLLWNLAAKRTELTGKITPVRLAKVVVIQQGYPELHKILQQRPYLLTELETFFRSDSEVEEQSAKENGASSTEKHTKNTAKGGEITDNESISLHPDLLPFSKHEALRKMLQLEQPAEATRVDGAEDSFLFVNLKAEEIAIYFTLTNRTDAPQPNASMSKSIPFISGQRIGGRYTLKYAIGRGGMSDVFLANDLRLHTDVAVKALRMDRFPASSSIQRRFEREINILSEISNYPNIVPIYDSGLEQGIPYYVMEYLPGGTLKELIRKKKVLTDNEIAEIIIPILDALNYLHENGIIHRDIKPSSIMFDNQGEPFLTDFGISKIIQVDEATNLTGTGIQIGTPAYMSPEQGAGHAVDFRSDLYAIGVVIYECMVGKTPFAADTPIALIIQSITNPPPAPSKINPNVTPELELIVLKLLSKKPEDRYQSAKEAKAALKTALRPTKSERATYKDITNI